MSELRGVAVVRAFESLTRGAELVDVSGGHLAESEAIECFLSDHGIEEPQRRMSADLISRLDRDSRLIEVKTRGGSGGPVFVPERQLDTFRSAGRLAWLYLVLNTTQPQPVQLFLCQDPGSLPWEDERAAEREWGEYRGVRHEARFRVDCLDIKASAIEASLDGLDLPAWSGANRD